MMRTATFCLAMLAVATESAAQKDLEKERVTLRFNRVAIQEVIPPLAKSLGYDSFIDPNFHASVTIQVEGVTARTALTAVCESVGCRWQKVAKLILVEPLPGYIWIRENEKGRALTEQMKKEGRWSRTWVVESLDETLPNDITWSSMPLDNALSILADAFKAKVDIPDGLGSRLVSLTVKSATLREAFDAVCATAGCRWEVTEQRSTGGSGLSRLVRVNEAGRSLHQRVYDISEPGVTAPQPIWNTHKRPVYTDKAKRANVEGMVVLSVVVDTDGSVREASIVQSVDKKYGMDDEVLKAVKQWRFTAGTKDGRPAAVQTQVMLGLSPPR